MKKNLLKLSFILSCLYTATTLNAQWLSKGPYGGAMTSLTKDNTSLYVGTMANGVFKSSDNGLTWMAANKGLERTWVNDVETSSAGLFAGTSYKGVYFSADQGASWMARNNGLIDLNIVSLHSVGSDMWLGNPEGVYYSSDNGLTWQSRSNGIPYTYVVYAWAHMGDTLYAGTYGQGLFRTWDKGISWHQVASGFPVPTQTGPFVYALATSGNTIYASTNHGIYLSTNRGNTWAFSGNNFMTNSANHASSLAVVNGTLFAGMHSQGIYYSNDKGVSFIQATNGLQWFPDFPPYQKTTDIIQAGTAIVAATHFGLYRSTNNAQSWSDANEGVLATDVTAVVNNGTATFAGTEWAGMYATTDGGNTWYRANNGLTGNHIRCMATSQGEAFASVQNERVWKSTNNGLAWTWAGSGLPADAVIMEADSDRVLAVTAASKYVPQKLYETTDRGLTWHEIPTTAMGSGFTAIAVRHPYIYIGTGNGILLRSSNGGQGWGDISHYMPNVKITTILPLDTVTYVGTEGKGIFMYLKNDSYMIPSIIGLTNYFITDIIMQDGVLFASTTGGGIFVSSNGGVTWSAMNGGLENLDVVSLAGDSMKVFAATDAGVYHTNQNAFKIISILAGVNENKMPESLTFYPNPSSGIVNYDARETTQVEIFTVSGNLIERRTVDQGEKGQLDISHVPTGIYILKLSSANGTSSKKVVIQ